MTKTNTMARRQTETAHNRDDLARRYRSVRRASETICAPLEVEDYCIQSMPDVSPTKWHLAHTSWFFETFVLAQALPTYVPPHAKYNFLFNSYYNAVGDRHLRPERGLLSRPTVAEIMDYREHVDDAMEDMLATNDELDDDLLSVIETGLHHEQQHQELMLMDIKHVFSCTPLRPAYRELTPPQVSDVRPLEWIPYEGELRWIGHDGEGFAFDNESPRHRTYVERFQIADRLITCGEFLEFIEDGGYQRPDLWLSDGWNIVQSQGWQAPLYWQRESDAWRIMTLGGMSDLNLSEPVSHVSFYEADAFASWMGCWLPRENAWEVIAAGLPIEGNFVEQEQFQPLPPAANSTRSSAGESGQPLQMFGDLWEWTCSPYGPFPGFRAADGALSEYNGKFMCNQMVLRGGSYGTPCTHIRPTYRNFFPPDARWPFTGIRLTKELD